MFHPLHILLSALLLFPFVSFRQQAGTDSDSLQKDTVVYNYSEVQFRSDSVYRKLILDTLFQAHHWDTLPQLVFWQKVMKLPPDSAIMSVYSTRKIIEVIESKKYSRLSKKEVERYRDSLRKANDLPDSERILFTPGKNFFYQFANAIPNIDTSISVFIENKVDPWYAQAILLIESPNKLQKSNVGAYGPFQLMKGVAKKFGLKISKKCDERKSLKRSAYAASQLLNRICIPSIREMLDSKNIKYAETDLWFRLLVMHTYHAGSNNVKAVIEKIHPREGSMALIFLLWQTEAGKFRNASQNYSQVLITALIELNRMAREDSRDIRKSVVLQKSN
jgi:hypothetical protein